jgi:hypothetical protein
VVTVLGLGGPPAGSRYSPFDETVDPRAKIGLGHRVLGQVARLTARKTVLDGVAFGVVTAVDAVVQQSRSKTFTVTVPSSGWVATVVTGLGDDLSELIFGQIEHASAIVRIRAVTSIEIVERRFVISQLATCRTTSRS